MPRPRAREIGVSLSRVWAARRRRDATRVDTRVEMKKKCEPPGSFILDRARRQNTEAPPASTLAQRRGRALFHKVATGCSVVTLSPRARRRAGLAHGVQGVVAEHDAMASEESPRAARHPPPAQLCDQRILFRRVCVHGAAIRKGGQPPGTVPRAYAVPVGRVAALRREARSSHLERG